MDNNQEKEEEQKKEKKEEPRQKEEQEQEQEQEEKNNIIKDEKEYEKRKNENQNKIINNENKKITDTEINSNNKNRLNNNNYEEESKNDKEEEKKSEELENKEKLTREKRKNQIEMEKTRLIELEKKYNDLLNNIIKNWETNRENYEKFYETQVHPVITSMLLQPCIIGNQTIIIFIFKFLCNYFYFLKDKLKEIPLKQINILYWTFTDKCNLFSKYPKINNNYNYNIFNENYDLISDKLFYYLFKEILPDAEIENSQLASVFNYNCMMKYFLEYLIKIGFIDNYINVLLSREDIEIDQYLSLIYPIFVILNSCDDNFILKNNYNINFIRNFTKKMNYWLNNSQEILKKNGKDCYFQFIKYLNNNYYVIIYGCLGRILEKYEKNEFENFLFSIYNFFEFLLKQQKLELKIFSLDQLIILTISYKIYDDQLKKLYNDSKNVYEFSKKIFISFLVKMKIFDLIFGENIHEALIERCYDILSFLYKNNSFTKEQISFLWKISQSKYQSINNSIITLFGRILPEFSIDDCNTILKSILNMNYNEVNETTLKLLENFFLSEYRHENLLNILFKYSNELSFYEGLSIKIIDKSREILIKLLFNKNYIVDLIQCIKNCLFCLDNNYLLNTNRNIFIDIMNEFIKNEKSGKNNEIFKAINENIVNFGILISYLDEKYSMLSIFMNNLLFFKKLFLFFVEQAIKIKNLKNEKNNDLNSIVDINNFLLKYKEYEKSNFNNENKKDINNNIINDNKIDDNKNINYILPKKKDDIDNYFKIIIKDFINYLKKNIIDNDNNLINEEIIYNIFTKFEFLYEKNTYHIILNKIINAIFSVHEFGNIYIKRDLIEFLFNFLVNNCLYYGEKDIFFNFIKNILEYKIHNDNLNLITDENIEYICLDQISSNDINNLPFSAYEVMSLYLIYINRKNGNIIFSNENNKFIEIKKIDLLVGFKTILRFYIYNNDMNIAMSSLSILTNIIEVSAKDVINRKYLLDELFSLLEKFKIKIKETINESKNPLRRILRLISVVNRTKVSKNIYDKNDSNNLLDLKINNNYFNNNNNNIFTDFQAFKGLTVKEFKNELIDKVICTNDYVIYLYNNLNMNPYQNYSSLAQIKEDIKNNNSIILYYNDLILKNDFTLADYNIQSGENILILNAWTSQNFEDFSMGEEQLKEGYEQIRVVFGDKFSEEIMKEALYNQRGDIQNAIIYMTDENNVMNLINEIENKKNYEPKRTEELICLDEKRFNLLLDMLNEGDNDLNDCIWDLFCEIKFPEDFIINIIENDFDKINEENNINKKLLILKIVNSVIFDDDSFCKNNKLNKNIKNKWISKFIKNENCILQILKFVTQIKIEKKSEIIYSQIIDIIINFFKKILTKIKELNKNKDKSDNKNNINENLNIDKIKEENEKKQILFGEFEFEENEGDNFIIILSKNNFVSLFYNILSVVLELSKAQTKVTKKNIIKNIYDILINYIEIIPNDINQFLEEENKHKKILTILTSENEIDIRKSSLNFIKKLIDILRPKNNESNENKNDIQSYLLYYYYPNLISDEIYHEEFYELYYYLFNLETLKSNKIEIDKIIEKFFDNLYDFYIKNENNKDNNDDKSEQIKNKLKYNLYILCSFSPYYDNLLKNEIEKKLLDNKDIISLLYNCLFIIETNKENSLNYLFSDIQLRNNCFSLLSNLISLDKKYFIILLKKIIHHHEKIIEKKTDLPLNYPLRDKSDKFLGLKNLGATCYINSLFQQLFMIPSFQKDIFNFDLINTEKENNNNLKESTIYNMQIAFANLKKSVMSCYPPISFINTFKKAFNGEPIRLGVQQDTDEFLSILCDQLEKEAKTYGKENFLENSFKGKITNEIVSLEKEFPYYSQTEEQFYRITLDIKGHKNLENALDAYVKGEILDGDNKYYVEKYKRKLSIKKRTSLKKIGNVIIIHLKRFEFDFVTFHNNKLNDYLEFPLEINLKKWTRAFLRMNELKDNNDNNISKEEKDNLDDEKMNYELTGILVHSGSNLQSGHYYSFIKDQENDKWYKFNDSEISEYNINKDLEKECFGNIDNKINQFGKGAYLLFYTKKEDTKKNKNFNQEIIINEKILNEVEKENINFLKIRIFSSDIYHKFFMKFINLSKDYLKEENENNKNDDDINNNINENKYSILINPKIEQKIKIYEKILNILKENKENKENNININENEIKELPNNIKEIYEKTRNEITVNDNDIINIENINLNNIIKLIFYYFFGIVFQFSDKEDKLKDCVDLIKEILSNNKSYSVIIMKLIEDNINLFIDLLFKYGFIDKDMTGINQHIFNLYKILFNSINNFEKEKFKYVTPELYYYLDKDENGKIILQKTQKSLFLRTFKKIFCDNLEKCRKEYSRDYLFLNLFLLITISNPESCIVSSNYLIPLISFITNNNLPELKSSFNPNYKMGNGPSPFYLSIFCEIILRCATPWMEKTRSKTPYFLLDYSSSLEKLDLYLYPKLPEDWRRMLFKPFLFNYILSNNNNNTGKILCHLCYEDESTSITILNLINKMLKQKYYKYPDIENISLNACKIFEINDSFTQIRLETLFEFEKIEKKDSLIKHYINLKYQLPNLVLDGLYIISKIIAKYNNVYEYFKKNQEKIRWVNDYYMEFFMETNDKNNITQNLGKILNCHPDLFEVIEGQFINRLDI